MINRDDIEAGDKCFTRDGGCLVARLTSTGDILLGENLAADRWYSNGAYIRGKLNPLDIIRIEKAPKPVVEVKYVCWDADSDDAYFDIQDCTHAYDHAIKLTIINGVWDKEKSEQVK